MPISAEFTQYSNSYMLSVVLQYQFKVQVKWKYKAIPSRVEATENSLVPRLPEIQIYKSLVVSKPAFCICENKDADQLRGNREADQRLCFRYSDSTITLLPKSEIPSLQPSSVAVQPGLCHTWSETPKTGFPRTRLI